MPREITHYQIAKEVSKQLDLSVDDNILKFSSIFHDILYYYEGSNEFIKKIPDKFHGTNKENSFDLIKIILKKLENYNNQVTVNSFIIGLITHIFTDANFHPLVYYFTGNYYDKNYLKRKFAAKRHRNFEILIDIYFCGNDLKKLKEIKYNKILNNEIQHILYYILDSNTPFLSNDILFDIINSYRNFISKRQKYLMPFVGNLLFSLKYPKKIENNKEFTYKHPVTGKEQKSTLDYLKEKSINESIKFYNNINTITNSLGISLETGLELSSVNEMKHFSEDIWI